MPTKKQTSTQPQKTSVIRRPFWPRRIVRPLLITLAILLVVGQLAFDAYIIRIALPNADNGANTIQLIESAVEGSTRPVQVQADSGEQYIAEVRLALPATVDYGLTPLRYAYEPAVDGVPAVLRVSSVSTVERAEAALLYVNQPKSLLHHSDENALIAEVPSLQACARGVYVFFGPNDAKSYSESLQYKAQAQLKDGRVLYMYTEQPNVCKQSSFESLIAYIKQAQSY